MFFLLMIMHLLQPFAGNTYIFCVSKPKKRPYDVCTVTVCINVYNAKVVGVILL